MSFSKDADTFDTNADSGSVFVRVCFQVSGKLIDKEQTLEEEIQLRERMQLQCKQAERMVDDLTMELQTTNQAKEDLMKQVKQAQVLLWIITRVRR